MKNIKKIFALMRTDAKTSGRSILPMLLIVVMLCAGCVVLCLSVVSNASDTPDKVKLAIVDKDGSVVSRLAIGMVTANEDIANLFSVLECKEDEEAYDAVYNGEAIAALIFEKGYFQKIINGESSAVNIVLSREMELHSQLIRDFGATGEILIKTGEYGIQAAWRTMVDSTDNYDAAVFRFNVMSLEYAVEILALTGKSVDGVLLPYSTTSDSLVGHYLLHYTVLLLSLVDMLFFNFVRRSSERTLLCRLKSSGVSPAHIIISKLPPVIAVKGALLAAVLVGIGLLHPLTPSVFSVFSAVFAVLLSSVVGVCLCTLTVRSDVGPCIICALSFAGLFLSGGLVPYDMLPVSVTRFGSFTNIGLTSSLLTGIFGGDIVWTSVLLSVLMAAALSVAAGFYLASLRTKGSDAQ